MAVIPIRKLPDQVLRQQAREITEINGELQRLIDDMAETMYAAPGLGLAANQVGGLHRLIVFDVTHRDGGARDLKVIINPCITQAEGELTHEEGCLSVADFSAEVRRHARVTVKGPGPGRQTPEHYRRRLVGRGAPARSGSSGRHPLH